MKEYESCTLCPRKCAVNRAEGCRGFCGETDEVRIAFAGLHFGEEPVITSSGGSGTVFFTGCNLRCPFCQNYQISSGGLGRAVMKDEFIKICKTLQEKGARNINLVTASHIVPRLVEYLKAARDSGVSVPYCWNSSAYESIETLEYLKGLVTVWLPDLKTLSPSLSKSIFLSSDYPDVATRAIEWMIKNNPLRYEKESMEYREDTKEGVIWDEKKDNDNREMRGGKESSGGIEDIDNREEGDEGCMDEEFLFNSRLTSGVIVRHLFLPGCIEESKRVLDWLYRHADSRAIISLMTQYTPITRKDTALKTPALPPAMENRFVNMEEVNELKEIARVYNFHYLYYQDLNESDIHDSSWLPDFNNVHTFYNALSIPVWHWRTGFV